METTHEDVAAKAPTDRKYVVYRGAIHPQACQIIKNTLVIVKEGQYYINNVSPLDLNHFADGRPVKTNCFGTYAVTATEGLLQTLCPLVEEAWGRRMYPTFSFARIYWRGATMAKHFDQPVAEYSITACIDVEGGDPWPIWMDGEELVLQPGDLVTYRGMEAAHWREMCECRQQVQVFMHYVAQDGPHAHHKWDSRPRLGLQKKGFRKPE